MSNDVGSYIGENGQPVIRKPRTFVADEVTIDRVPQDLSKEREAAAAANEALDQAELPGGTPVDPADVPTAPANE